MKYWDASALVPLIVEQKQTTAMKALHREDGEVVTWVLSEVEVRSAVARLERQGSLQGGRAQDARSRAEVVLAGCHVVSALEVVVRRAKRILDVHALRAADALRLAAAIVASDESPESWTLVTLDDRLRAAAQREGFAVSP